MMLAPAEETGQAHVVRDAAGRVVLICWGEDATGVAAHWASRGYQVYPVARHVLGSEVVRPPSGRRAAGEIHGQRDRRSLRSSAAALAAPAYF